MRNTKNSWSLILGAILSLVLLSCEQNKMKHDGKHSSFEEIEQDIRDVEKAFADMAKDKGIAEAFVFFAAEDAVLNRNDSLIIGKDAIQMYFEMSNMQNDEVSLTWSPDFVRVSKSGDLAYTYGRYQYQLKNKPENLASGIFHTVWKKQANGLWKYVWD